ncbi:hypothetical protein D3C71_1931460 [compost metagenome]
MQVQQAAEKSAAEELDEMEALEAKMADRTLTYDEAVRLGRLSLQHERQGPPTARKFERSRDRLGMFSK